MKFLSFFNNKVSMPMYMAYGFFFVMALTSYFFKSLDSTLALLPEFFLVFMYIFSTKKIEDYLLIYFSFYCLGDVFHSLRIEYYDLVMFTISHFFLIVHLLSKYIKKISKVVFFYLLLFFLLFAVVYFYVIDDSIEFLKLPIIGYGISLCSLAALLFYLYFNTLNKVFFLFIVGVSLKIISDCLITIRIYGTYTDLVYYAIVQGLYFLGQFFLCLGLVKNK